MHLQSASILSVSVLGVPSRFPTGATANLPYDLNNLDATLAYEIPDKIRTLHQLALQHVNQVKPVTLHLERGGLLSKNL